MINGITAECVVCGAAATKYQEQDPVKDFYSCPVCGRYEHYLLFNAVTEFDLNHLGSYLAYNGFQDTGREYRYFTTMSKEKCDEYKKNFEGGDYTRGHPVHLNKENVENWYPKSFLEKVDHILQYLNSYIRHMGEQIVFSKEKTLSWLFIDRYDYVLEKAARRTDDEIEAEMDYMMNYLIDRKYIFAASSWSGRKFDRPIGLAPDGYARVDMLQRNLENEKDVLVAMAFGDDTIKLREAIRKGITDAGYVAVLIDEVEHNGFITPELLKYIRDSKFVVVDLSHQNNGAYFEEGYAMGLGKPVIQLCKKDVRLHFDIAQKNTIIWESEEEIAERLKNRIIATID